ncbi:MAG: histidine kinase [Eubacteriales bacterium]
MIRKTKIKKFPLSDEPFRRKLIICLVSISLLMVVYTGFTSYQLANKKVYDMSVKLSENTIASAKTTLSTYLSDVHLLSTNILFSSDLRNLAAQDSPDSKTIQSSTARIGTSVREQISSGSSAGITFDMAAIYLKNGFTYTSSSTRSLPFTGFSDCMSALDSQGLNITSNYVGDQWTICDVTTKLSSKSSQTASNLVFVRYIYDPVTIEKLGVSLFVINAEELYQIYAPFTSDGFIMSTDGTILSSIFAEDIGSLCSNKKLVDSVSGSTRSGTFSYVNGNNKEELISYITLLNGTAFLVVPFDYYTTIHQMEIASYVQSIIILAVIGVIITLLLSLFFSKRLTQTITKLILFVKQVDSGHTTTRFQASGHDEIAYLGEKTNEMLDRLQTAAEARESALLSNQVLELRLIQSQINPHLLYNTLDSVLWGLQEGRIDDSTALIASLSQFFKLSLSQGRLNILLADELALIKHYLQIQLLARKRHIQLICSIEPTLNQYPIIKLLLLPIIENSIIHGFDGYRATSCIISIDASHTDCLLTIIITDNGIGMLEEDVTEINQTLQQYPLPENMRHFGLYNTNRRLVQSFGEQYGLIISSNISEYTRVTITMPYFPGIQPVNEPQKE